MRKSQPQGAHVLCVESVGWAGGEFGIEQAVDGLKVRYSLESDGDLEILKAIIQQFSSKRTCRISNRILYRRLSGLNVGSESSGLCEQPGLK